MRYPIRYGRAHGSSIWREREILDMLYLFGLIEKKGAWISFSDQIIKELKQKKIDCPEKIQGEPKLIEHLEKNKKMTDFLYRDFKKLGDAL